MMLVESNGVLDRVDGNHLVPSTVNIFQPEQQTVTHFMKLLLKRTIKIQLLFICV